MNDPDNQPAEGQKQEQGPDSGLYIKVCINSPGDQIKSAPDENKQDKWPRRTAKAVIIYTIFTFIIILISAYQIYLTNQNLQITNRSFVSIESAGTQVVASPQNSTLIGVSFGFNLINSGNTPTKNLLIGYSCYPSEKEVREPWLLYVEAETTPHVTVPIFIGAHSHAPIACGFNRDQLYKMQQKTMFGYIMVRATYFDRISLNIQRRTELAQKVTVDEIIEGAGRPILSAHSENIGRHNCADEECPEDNE